MDVNHGYQTKRGGYIIFISLFLYFNESEKQASFSFPSKSMHHFVLARRTNPKIKRNQVRGCRVPKCGKSQRVINIFTRQRKLIKNTHAQPAVRGHKVPNVTLYQTLRLYHLPVATGLDF